MPKYTKNYRSSRSSRRKAPYRSRSRFTKSVSAIAKRVVYRNREAKAKCSTVTSTPLTTSWQLVQTLNNTVAEGDGADDRDGLSIRVSGIQLKLRLAASVDRPQACRLFVIKKKEDFTSADDLPSATVSPLLACVEPHMKTKYTVLIDKIINIEPMRDDSGTSLLRNVYRNFWIRQNSKLTYSGPLATDLDVGRIYVYAVCDALGGGTDSMDYVSESIMHFKDM